MGMATVLGGVVRCRVTRRFMSGGNVIHSGVRVCGSSMPLVVCGRNRRSFATSVTMRAVVVVVPSGDRRPLRLRLAERFGTFLRHRLPIATGERQQ